MQRTAHPVGVFTTRAAKVDKVDKSKRTIRFIASDETVDRYGDIIRADGWLLDNFKKNPVLLFGHQHGSVPVGKVTSIDVDEKQLIAETEFRPEGDDPFADNVWKALDGGFLNASSVGFFPTKNPLPLWKDDDEESGILTGFEYIEQELLELSVVPVPANPSALALAKSLRIDEATQRRLFDVRDGITRAAIEAQRRSATLAILQRRHA